MSTLHYARHDHAACNLIYIAKKFKTNNGIKVLLYSLTCNDCETNSVEKKMNKLFLFTLTIFILTNTAFATTRYNTVKTDKTQVNKWNNFVTELYQLHLNLTKRVPVKTSELSGGYGGGFANKTFYREISYFNKNTNQLISKIQWETEQPDKIHTIEVYLYDKRGRVKTDFYARYLPYARNAPVQTLINLHNYSDNLHAFRQFDANGELIYETCRGKLFNETINLHLDNEEILDFRTENSDEMLNEAYTSCFLNVSQTAENYLHPNRFNTDKISKTGLSIDYHVSSFTQKIKQQPKNPALYVQRGELYFQSHDFDKAIDDFKMALQLDDSFYKAYFWRGMALARNGQIEEGINDLTKYIQHNPGDSRAYTKRGVRYIWAGKLDKAQKDLLMAIKLDKTNSEAHDDLGVIYAQQKKFDSALKHFSFAIQYDPTYQKAHHNQAMAFILTNNPQRALLAINKSLVLDSNSRNSLMLKSEILIALGKNKEAESVIKKAEFLPEGNWSERFNIRQ